MLRDFYSNKTIFMTGSTGMIGLNMLKKVTHDLPEVRRVYALVRNPEKAAAALMHPKVTYLQGDITRPDMGITDRGLLSEIKRTTGVFMHLAANTRWEQDMSLQLELNTTAALHAADMAKEMPRLKAFVYTSTYWGSAHVPSHTIMQEKVYHTGMDPWDEYQVLMQDNRRREILLRWIDKTYPVYYSYTKGLVDRLLDTERYRSKLPILIARLPSIVHAQSFPYPGWGLSHSSVPNIYRAILGGFFNVVPKYHKNHVNDNAPTDMTVNMLLANAAMPRSERGADVINTTTSNSNPIEWEKVAAMPIRFYDTFIGPRKLYWADSCESALLAYQDPGRYGIDMAGIPDVKKYGKVSAMLLRAYDFAFNRGEWIFDDKLVRRPLEHMSEEEKRTFNIDTTTIDWDKLLFDMCTEIANRRDVRLDQLRPLKEGPIEDGTRSVRGGDGARSVRSGREAA